MDGVLADLETSALPEPEKALLRFVARVNSESAQIDAAVYPPLRELGWTDEQLYYAITVCALFNFYNRWIDATGVHPLSPEGHVAGGKRTAQYGYVRK